MHFHTTATASGLCTKTQAYLVKFRQVGSINRHGHTILADRQQGSCIKLGACIGSLVWRRASALDSESYIDHGHLIFIDIDTKALWVLNPAKRDNDLDDMIDVSPMIGIKESMPLQDDDINDRNAFELKVSISELDQIMDDQEFMDLIDLDSPEVHLELCPTGRDD